VAAAAATPLWGQEYRLALGADVAYDDNILRLSSNVSPSDVGLGNRPRGSPIYRAYVDASAEIPVSRQVFGVRLIGNVFKFSEYSYLDYSALNGGLTWRWQAGDLWNGLVSYEHTKDLAPFIDFSPIVQDLRTLDAARVTAEYWLHPSWRLYAGGAYTDGTNSSDLLKPSDFRVYTGELGVTYRGVGDNYIRGLVAYSDGEYPNREPGSPFGAEYNQVDFGLDVLWNFSDKTSLYGRAAYTDRHYPNASGRDFGGPTGNLTFNWGLTGRTAIKFDLRREISPWEDVSGRFYITDAVGVAPSWEITSVLRLEAGYEYWRRTYPNEGILNVPARNDTLNFARVALKWTPARSWLVRVGYQWSTRDSNVPLVDFRDNLFLATVEFSLNR
jgi:exopolysaccharide biosynthesis operon protein EpsL